MVFNYLLKKADIVEKRKDIVTHKLKERSLLGYT